MDLKNDGAIIGYGVVGRATAKLFNIQKYFDIKESSADLSTISNCRYVFISLPTPLLNGECDTSLIRGYCKQLSQYPRAENMIVIVRSTVTPGTCRSIHDSTGLNIVSHPEFLSDDSLQEDTVDPMAIVIGTDDPLYEKPMWDLYKESKCPIKIKTDTVTAETIKYALNTFFALKVVFANQLYDVCEKSGADYSTIKTMLLKHPWGSGNHFRVEDKGGRGAGGRCLPKDLGAFVTYSQSPLLKKAQELNNQYLHQSHKE